VTCDVCAVQERDHSPLGAWSRIMPRLWVESSFKFPVGVKIHDAWLRWHCGEQPLRVVTSKMLPVCAERQRQCTLRRKFKGVMEIIQGQTKDSIVDMDVDYVWDVCWRRTVELFNIHLPCNWVISTAYDFFLKFPDKVKQARQSPPCECPDVAVAAAARAAKVAEDTRTFAIAMQAAPMARNHPVPFNETSTGSSDQPVFTDDAARIVADAILEVAGPAALQPPPVRPSLPAAVRKAPVRRAAPSAPASVAPTASTMLQQPPFCIALNPFWPVPTNLWMPGEV
jgi:hypothetical protein